MQRKGIVDISADIHIKITMNNRDYGSIDSTDYKVASIMFMPVCTKCLKIIWQEVDASQSIDFIGATYDISPNKCPHCGALFNSIEIPAKLPFNLYDYVT